MNRYTIVLAEEKATIQRLVKKAIDTKPVGQERIESIKLVNDEAQFFESLDHYPSIILLSTTFSSTSHEDLLKKVSEQLPNTKVISLTNKYGDRSSIDLGAFDSVDKPIRNPVLWRVVDGAIEAMDAGTPARKLVPKQPKPEPKQVEKEIIAPVVEKEVPVAVIPEPVREVKEEIAVRDEPVVSKPVIPEAKKPVIYEEPKPVDVKPIVEAPRPNPTSMVVISDDDDDDDDLFGDSVPVRRSTPPAIADEPVIKEVEVVEREEDVPPVVIEEEEEESFTFEADEPKGTTETAPEEEFFEFDLPEEKESRSEPVKEEEDAVGATPVSEFELSQDEDTNEDTKNEEDSFSFEVSDTEDEPGDEQVSETEEEEEGFSFEAEPPVQESTQPNTVEQLTTLPKETPVEKKIPEPVQVPKPVPMPEPEPAPFVFEEPVPVPVKVEKSDPAPIPAEVERTSDTLEPQREIKTEAPIYNELSEWTLAHEGFKTKKGEFVPLAPPREMMMKHSPSGGKANRSNSSKAASNDGDKLFGSVRNIFKKK